MANSAEFKILVSAVGELTKAIQQTNTLGKNVNKLGAAHDEAAAKGKKHNDVINSGVGGANNASRSFSRLLDTVGGQNSGLVAAYATLATNAFAVSAAFTALRNAAAAEQVLAGLEAQGNRTGRTLTLAAESVKEITGAAVSSAEAMQATALFSAAGFGREELEKLTQVATDTSFALGRNLPDSLDRLIKGTTKLEPELLDELGIMTKLGEATAIYAREHNKTADSLGQFEKRQAFLNAVLAEGEIKFGGISEAAGDLKGYDKLAASFDDLTKSLFNLLNVGLLPVVNLMANNTGVLAGTLTIFAGSIRNQLIPGLKEASAAQEKLAEKAQEAATAQAQSLSGVSKGPKVYNELAEKIREGTAVTADYDRALKSLNKSEEQRLKYLNAGGLKNPAQSQADLKLVQDQKAALQDLMTTMKDRERISKNAAALEYASEISLLNLRSSMRGIIDNTRESVAIYASQTVSGNTKVSQSLRLVKIGFYGVATGAKVAGVAILNMLPVIGQIIMAAGLIYEGFKYIKDAFTSEEQKQYNKAVQDLSTILDTMNEKAARFQELNSRTAQLSLIQVEKYKLVSNSINEIVGQMNKVIEAEGKLGQTLSSKVKRMQVDLEATMQPKSINSENGTPSAGIKAIQDTLFKPKNAEILDSEEFKAASAIYKFGISEINKEYLKLLHADEEFTGSSASKKREKLAQLNIKIANTYGAIGEAVESATNNLKQLEQDTTAFFRSAISSTPFDALANSLIATNASLEKLDITFKESGVNAKQLADTLSGIGPETAKMLSAGTREAVENARELAAEIESMPEKISKASALEAYALEAKTQQLKRQLESSKSAVLLAKDELVARERYVLAMQESARLAKDQASLEQARLQNFTELSKYSSIAVRDQLEKQNRILDLQAKQSQAQAAFIKAQISADKAHLESLQNELKQLGLISLERLQQQKLALEGKLQTDVLAMLNSVTAFTNPPKIPITVDPKGFAETNKYTEKSAQEYLATAKALEEVNKKLIERQKIDAKIKATTDSIRSQQQAADSLAIQSAVILEGKKTQAEIKAIEASTIVEIANATEAVRQSALKAQRDLKQATTEFEEIMTSILNGTPITIGKVAPIIKQATDELESFSKSAKDSISNLEAELNKITSNRSRSDLTSTQLEAIKQAEDTIKTRITYIREELMLKTKSLEYNTLNNLVEAIGVTKAEDRLNAELENYSVLQKTLEARAEEINLLSEIKQLETDMEIIRLGGSTAQASYAERVNAAEQALEIAKMEADMKKAVIALEFALLMEKRKDVARQLVARRDEISKAQKAISDKQALERAKGSGENNIPGSATDPKTLAAYALTAEALRMEAELSSDLLEAMGATITESGNIVLTGMNETLNTLLGNVDKSLYKLDRAAEKAKQRSRYQGSGTVIGDMRATFKDWQAEFPEDQQKSLVSSLAYVSDMTKTYMDSIKESLSALGPQGEIVIAIGEGITNITGALTDMAKTLEKGNSLEKIAAGLNVASAMVSTIAAISKASSDAKIANIDREIAAEEKRDGKSAASIAKLEAMEKKKDSIARKAFNTNKKLMMAQAVISTAAGIAGALGSMPGPAGIILAGIIGAMGAAQLAIIASTQYESSYSPKSAAMPSTLTIGKRSDTVDLAKGPNANAGGEVGFLRGTSGTGSNASNYRTVGSAYGGELTRGYGNRGFVVGEKGPEIMDGETPINVTPLNEYQNQQPISANISIQALDASDVKRVLVDQRGNIIQMLREAANASGKTFMEDVNVNVYTKPSIGRL